MAQKILFEITAQDVGVSRRLEELRAEIRRLNKEIQAGGQSKDVYDGLITDLTLAKKEAAELKEQQRALNKEFQATRVPKDSLAGLRLEYSRLVEQIKVLSQAERQSPFGQSLIRNAAQVKQSIDGIEQSLGRFTGNVGNYRSAFGSLAQIISGGLIGGGLVLTLNEIAQATTRAIALNRELSDSIADVAKTTNLTDDELQGLIQTLEARGSRTLIFDQLNIAAIGGQLGVVDEQIADFTAGVDVLNVALGDQFGSVDVLTREFAGLRNVLTDFRTEDTADDILKLGNAVNYLEAQGNATGQSIVDFAGRIAGAGVPLGLTTDKIIGLSTTLAELAINPERGATAVNRLLQEVARSPDLFARAIGEPTVRFRKLVETDLLGAVALVSERISKGAASNVQFAQTLEELGIGSQGAIEVFGKLGGNIELLNTRIAQSGEQLQTTGSIYAEFEKRNNNAEAAVAKLQNRLIALATSETAEGIIKGVAEVLTDLVDILAEAPELIEENKEELIALGLVLFSFTGVAQRAAASILALATTQGQFVFALRAMTIAQTAAAAATRVFNAALNASPLIVLTLAIYGVVKAFEAYQEEASAAEKATRAVADAQEDIAEQSAAEVLAVEKAIGVLKSATATREEQKQAIDELIKINPEYLKGVDLEKASVSQLDEIQKGLTESIIKQVAARRKQVEQEKLVQQIIDARLDIERFRRGESTFFERNPFGARRGFTEQQLIEGRQKSIVDAENQLDALDSKFAEVFGLESPKVTRAAARAKQFRLETGIESDLEDLIDDQKSIFSVGLGLAKSSAGELGEELDKTGESAVEAGGKIKGLGDGLKQEADPVAGSLAFLRAEIARLNGLIEQTPGDPALLKPLVEQLKEAERQLDALEAKIAELKSPRIIAEIPTQEEIEAQLPGAGTERLTQEEEFARRAKEINAERVEDEEFTAEQIAQAQADLSEQGRALRERELADAQAAAEKRKEINEAIIQQAIDTAQAIADAVFSIEQEQADREKESALQALDDEFEARIAAAQGNATKITALQKEQAKRREAIEKQAAEKSKSIALKEAGINIALAITKALTGAIPPFNYILAAGVAVAGALQIAAINAQQFADSGIVKDTRAKTRKIRHTVPGIITQSPNAPRTAKGDNVLIYAKAGEMVLNETHQRLVRQIAGEDVFAKAGVPGESATRGGTRLGVQHFATSGVVGIVPQSGFSQQLAAQNQALFVSAKATFTDEQILQIAETQARIIAAEVGKSTFEAGVASGDANNRTAERQQRAEQNRKG